MRMSIAKALWTCLGTFVFVMIFNAGLSYWSANQIKAQLDDVAEVQFPAVRAMTLADMRHDGLRAIVMESIVVAGEKDKDAAQFAELKKEFEEQSADFNHQLEILSSLRLSSSTKDAIHAAVPEMKSYISSANKIVELASGGGVAAANEQLPDFRKSFSVLEEKMETLGELIEKDAALASSQGEWMNQLGLIFSAVVVLFLATFGFYMVRTMLRFIGDFLQKISHSGMQVATVSRELSGASQELANGASQSAASIEETVASLDEISAMVDMNTENAAVAQKISIENKSNAEEGNQEISTLVSSMGEISASSKRMEEIIAVIDDIAFQTNLLALNAAVEAARAGELGRGFAVVADAVRSLAQRSASAARDISQMIKMNVDKIKEGEQIVDRSSQSLQQIVVTVEKVSSLNFEIASASKEQSVGVSQLSKAMAVLDTASQKNAAVAEQVSASSAEMQQQAEELARHVEDMRRVVYGQAA